MPQWWRKRKAAKAADESMAARTNSYNPAFDRQAGVTATGEPAGWDGIVQPNAVRQHASSNLAASELMQVLFSSGVNETKLETFLWPSLPCSEHPEEPHQEGAHAGGGRDAGGGPLAAARQHDSAAVRAGAAAVEWHQQAAASCASWEPHKTLFWLQFSQHSTLSFHHTFQHIKMPCVMFVQSTLPSLCSPSKLHQAIMPAVIGCCLLFGQALCTAAQAGAARHLWPFDKSVLLMLL